MVKKNTAPEGNMISFNPDTFVTGGLFDDEDAVVKEAVFEVWDYGGKADREATALRLVLEKDDGSEQEQYWSVGDPDVYWPHDGGKWILSKKSALNSSSNFAIFLSTLIQGAGFPLDKIEGDISGLVGLNAHWLRVAPPKARSVKKDKVDSQGREQKDLVLVVSAINSLPGEKAKGKGKGKPAAAKPETTPAEGAGDDAEMEEACVGAVNMALLEAGGKLAKKDVCKKSGPFLPDTWDQPRKNHGIIKVIFDDGWLGAHPDQWTYANGVIEQVG